jgi:two-component system response regulator BaeR
MPQYSPILIVEDEIKIAQVLADFLHADGFSTHIIGDGAAVIDYVQAHNLSFILLDIMLPNKDGLTLCREIRQFSEVPILMLTARVDEIDRLMGLGFGADDYVCKPFSAREVVARIRAVLKRIDRQAVSQINTQETTPLSETVNYKMISLNEHKFECVVENVKVVLTPVEFRLLQSLMSKPGHVFSRQKLMNSSYEDSRIVSHRTIDSHMKNLRSKIAVQLPKQELIHTIYGLGYKLE